MPTKSTKYMESRLGMNKIELEMDNFDDNLKKMKAVEKNGKTNRPSSKKGRNNFDCFFLCLYFRCKSVFQRLLFLNREVDSRRLP
uniref:Uncharacterized protein n=1 Tax=Solanum lycopersicum TaxID=4081 RepID=A0A3Q7GKE5_SOLLC